MTDDAGTESRSVSTRRLVLAGLAILLIPVLSVLLTRDLPDLEIGVRERVLLPLLLGARLLLSWKTRRALVPWLDLPLLGLLFVFTGAASSPLDPAVFFVYALLAFHIEPSPGGFRTTASFVGGIVVMYGLLLWHVHEDQERSEELLRADLAETVAERRQEQHQGYAFAPTVAQAQYGRLRRLVDEDRASSPAVGDEPYFAPQGDSDASRPSLDRAAARTIDAVARREHALERTLGELRADLSSSEANALTERIADVFPATDDVISEERDALLESVDRVTTSEAAQPDRGDYQEWLDAEFFGELDVRLVQQDEVRSVLDEVIGQIHDLERRRDENVRELNRLATERVALAILILATLSLVAALRRAFEREVERRADRELGVKEREKENWIALTAGLTHTIGNDILAYDAYGEEALDAIEEFDGELPPEIEQNLKFIVDSNKARLAFIKFLDEFARARKELAEGRIRPVGLAEIPLPAMLRDVRCQVGEVEVADLPRNSRDPQVVRQREKFLELPIEVVVLGDDDAGTMTRGKRGILQFFFYELIKNGLRNCSGREPLRVELEKERGRVRIRFVNDLAVREVEGSDGGVRFVLPRLAGMEPVDEVGLRAQVAEILEHCFEPGRGGGTGLGLFLIRYFAREYYGGSVEARVHDWETRRVAFELELPDDLEVVAR